MKDSEHSRLLLAITIARCLPALISLIFFILGIVPLTFLNCFNIKTDQIKKSIKIIIICYFTMDLIASIMFAITAMAVNYGIFPIGANGTFEELTFIPHTLGHMSFYLVLMERLYAVYVDTIYQYNKCTFVLLSIFAVIIEIWHFCIHTGFDYFYNFSDKMDGIFISIFIALNILFGMTLIFLFIRNLLSLVVSQRTSISITTLKTKSKGSMERLRNKEFESSLDLRRVNMINMITKNCILCIAAVIFRNIGVIGFSMTHGHDDLPGISNAIFILLMMYNISLIFELLCLYMTFRFVDHWYQIICGKMHKWVFRCCKYNAYQRSLQADYDAIRDWQ